MQTSSEKIAAVCTAAGIDPNGVGPVSPDQFDRAIAIARSNGDVAKIAADRVQNIVEHAAAKGREEFAHRLASDTEMSADAAIGMLLGMANERRGLGPVPSRLERIADDPTMDARGHSTSSDLSALWDSVLAKAIES